MEITTYVHHRGLDLIVTITDIAFTPEEIMTRDHPGYPEEIEILDGFCELDTAKHNAVTQQVDAQLENNKRFFWAVYDAHTKDIDEQVEEECHTMQKEAELERQLSARDIY